MERNASDKKFQILLVEDSPSDAALLQENILLEGATDYRVSVVQSLHEAADHLTNNSADAVLLDLTLPDSSGLDTVSQIERIAPALPVVVLTGVDDENVGIEAVRMGVQDYLIKGRADGRTITRAVHYAIERKQMDNALRQARDKLEERVQERTAELAQTVAMLRHEITQRMQAEEAVRERSRDLDAFFSHTVMPLVILDKEFNFIRVNQAYANANARDISEFAGHNHFEFYPHEENQRIFEQVVKTKKFYEAVAKPFSFPDHPEWGITYWDWTLVPILDEQGEVEMLVFSLEDVTARKRSELALEESEARYRALVELSPDPILVVAGDKIAFANPACVELAKVRSADELVGREIEKFVHPDSRRLARTFLRAGLRSRKKLALTELKVLRPDGRAVHVEVSVGPIRYKGAPAVQAVVRDITGRKQQQARDSVTRVLLELFAQKNFLKEYLDSVVKIIRIWSGCRCVGIRLTSADGCIPYESCAGFSEEFVSAESMLCLDKDVCACIRVVAQTPDPQDKPVMTERGSFRCDDTFGFVKSLTETEKARYRGNCLKAGFASVAVVPVRYRQKVIGAIHLADEHENMVPLENVQFLENMAGLIGEAVHRFRIEQALRRSESRLVEAQRIAHLGNWDWDITRNTLWWSDEVYRIFGLQPQQFGATNEAFLACVHPEDRERVKAAVNEATNDSKAYSIDHRVIRPDGVERIVHEQAKVLYGPDKQPVHMVGTVQDVTEFKQNEQRILADQEALRSLASELQLAEERERRRIASDLHDSIGQILALSKWELVRLQKSLPADAAGSLNEVANQLDIAVKQARTLSFELSPSVLYDLGFEVALEDLAERFSRERKIKCEFRSRAGREPLPEAVKVLLYRSVRELLINVAKHANATLVKISLDKIGNDLHITVEDNGDGFDVSILNGSSRRPKGFGVLSIQERLRHIGGHFEIKSNGGSGTKVTLVAPTDTPEKVKQGEL